MKKDNLHIDPKTGEPAKAVNGLNGKDGSLGRTSVAPEHRDVFETRLTALLEACKGNLKSTNVSLVTRALYLCYYAHRNTARASGELYYTHPYEVALILAREIPLDDVSIAAALLHDVVEDTDYTIDDIREEFGPDVAEIVDGVTKITGVFNSHEITQAASYRKLLLSMVNDVRVILVKFADRLHNMRTLQYLPPAKQKRMARETLDIYAPFAHRFGLGTLKWELEDLSFKYLNPEGYDQLKRALKTKRKEREAYIDKAIAPVRQRLESEKIAFEIFGRAKHLYSIYNKMRVQNKGMDEIHDLIAIRIILDTDNPNDCFTVYGIVSEIFTPVPERFKNYISVPKKNGYQSIHTTVIGPEGKRIEIQIRTREMHEVAEKGVAAHFVYKDTAQNIWKEDRQLEEWAEWIRDVFERAEEEEAPHEVMESFRLNLFQDEIYVFTPKGELRILPKGATPVDFAFDIHSQVGFHCIGAKVNNKIIPLDTKLRSGDQVEILTSKNQTPSPDWEKFAATHKARSGVRRWLNEQKRVAIVKGKELWQKRAKKEKLHINDDELERVAHGLRYENKGGFFYDIGLAKITPEKAVRMVLDYLTEPPQKEEGSSVTGKVLYDRFVKEARDSASDHLRIDGGLSGIKYMYAQCCNPIPGDQVIGFIRTGKGVSIHRSSCPNAMRMIDQAGATGKVLDVTWTEEEEDFEFIAAVRVSGADRPGMLNDITHAIVSYRSTNIRSVNIESQDSLFEGIVTCLVRNTEHLQRLMDRLRKIPNVSHVERFDQVKDDDDV